MLKILYFDSGALGICPWNDSIKRVVLDRSQPHVSPKICSFVLGVGIGLRDAYLEDQGTE